MLEIGRQCKNAQTRYSAEPPCCSTGFCKDVSVLLEAFFILSIALTDFLFTFEIQYDSLLLMHDHTLEAKLVPKAFPFFFFIEEGASSGKSLETRLV